MIRLLLRLVLALLGNALGLWIASLVLDDMSISGAAFVVAVVIFTVLTAVLQPLVTKMAMQNAPALQGSSALVTTLVALVITDLVSDGLSISGLTTWILATIIVWLATMLASVLLPMFLFKELLEDRKD
ncbi:MAG TPA: phage holin family protein [Ilumatobacteraceae bacterium]|jgi:putative membrane protein|nr:phage holin family protein [Ilumatobacteraceae bacterium]